jgi:hypothetical protein
MKPNTPQYSAQVKNAWSFTPTPVCIHGVVVERMDIFALVFAFTNPWSGVLERLIIAKLIKKFLFYETRGFITIFTRVHNWSLP